MSYFALGRKIESDAALAQMLKSQSDHHPFQIAKSMPFAVSQTRRSNGSTVPTRKRRGAFRIIKTDPVFKKLESDPRYKAFLKKMNLPE